MNTIEQFIKEARARCDAATRGPWKRHSRAFATVICPSGDNIAACGGAQRNFRVDELVKLQEGNADFIANARQDLPAALEIIASLRARVAELEAALEAVSLAARQGAAYREVPDLVREALKGKK